MIAVKKVTLLVYVILDMVVTMLTPLAILMTLKSAVLHPIIGVTINVLTLKKNAVNTDI